MEIMDSDGLGCKRSMDSVAESRFLCLSTDGDRCKACSDFDISSFSDCSGMYSECSDLDMRRLPRYSGLGSIIFVNGDFLVTMSWSLLMCDGDRFSGYSSSSSSDSSSDSPSSFFFFFLRRSAAKSIPDDARLSNVPRPSTEPWHEKKLTHFSLLTWINGLDDLDNGLSPISAKPFVINSISVVPYDIGSNNGLSRVWRQAITWSNADLFSIGPLGQT